MSGLWLKLSRLPWQHHRLLPSELNLTALAADCTWKRECKCAPPLMIFLFIFFNAPLKLFFLLILVFQNSMIPTGLSWEDLLHPLYQKYKNHITWGDQDLLNIIFHYNPGTSSFFKCVCVFVCIHKKCINPNCLSMHMSALWNTSLQTAQTTASHHQHVSKNCILFSLLLKSASWIWLCKHQGCGWDPAAAARCRHQMLRAVSRAGIIRICSEPNGVSCFCILSALCSLLSEYIHIFMLVHQRFSDLCFSWWGNFFSW